MGSKVYVIGLDGATFDVISPLVSAGRLKNIGKAMADGAWGRLRSTVPAFSPVAWTSMMTGVNPGKTGIGDAFIHDTRDYRISFVNATYRRCRPLWTVMNDYGVSTGVFNIPLTYPPERVNGFMISGMFTPERSTDFVHPESLGERIRTGFGNYIFEAVQSPNPGRVVRSTYKAIEQRDRIVSFLLDEFDLDFYFLVFVETDRIQHQFWKFSDPESGVSDRERRRYGGVIADVYDRLDESIGKILSRVGDDDYVVFVSDHGFGPLRKAFALSNWLARNGYCAAPSGVQAGKRSLVARILRRLSGKKADGGETEINRFLSSVDWAGTRAYTEGAAGGLFINLKGRQRDGIVTEAEYEPLRDELIERLTQLRDPASGQRVVERAYKKEEAYFGDGLEGLPDIIVTCTRGFHTISPSECLYYGLSGSEMFFPHAWSGRHDDYGIFIARGPGVSKGRLAAGADIMDVAPTLLHMAGLPLTREFDGRIPDGLFDEAHLAARPPEYTGGYSLKAGDGGKDLSDEESRQLEERLRNLGYI